MRDLGDKIDDVRPDLNPETKARVLAVHADLTRVLNEHGIDNELGIPDFILAEYLLAHLGHLKTLDDRIRAMYA
jgi:hypothetical protein